MPMGQLTDEEMAEYQALKAAQTKREEEAKEDAPPPPDHWLHLANGQVVEYAGTMTHYKGVRVMNAEPMESGQK